MRSAISFLLLLGLGCSQRSEVGKNPSTPVATPQQAPENADTNTAFTSSPKKAQAAPLVERSVQRVHVPGATTREELKGATGGTGIDGAEFLLNLDAASLAVADFVMRTPDPAKPKDLLASFSDFEVREHDLRALVVQTTNAMERSNEAPAPKRYKSTDSMDWPRVFVVWQQPLFHRVLKISRNNDNTAVSLFVGDGEFVGAAYGVQDLTEIPGEQPVLEAATFLGDKMTIWPHIEEYFVCPAECP